MIFRLLFLLTACYGCSIILPIKKTIMFFPVQITYNDQLPVELYSSFKNSLTNKDIEVIKSSGNVQEDCNTIENLLEKNDTITLLSHSTGVNNLFKICNKVENITNIVLVDPILLKNTEDRFVFNENFEDYISDLIESDKFSLLKDIMFKKNNKKNLDLKNVDNILYVSSKKSSRWKILPPVPPIKRMFMDYDLIKNKNKKMVTIPEYGHFDILDSQWADAIHGSLSKGTNNRDEVEKYHEEIARYINEL